MPPEVRVERRPGQGAEERREKQNKEHRLKSRETLACGRLGAGADQGSPPHRKLMVFTMAAVRFGVNREPLLGAEIATDLLSEKKDTAAGHP